MRTTDRLLISSRCLGFLLVCLGATALSLNAAQTYTWNGGASTAWLTTTNWTPNGIPGADDTAIINSGVPSLPGPSETLPHIQLNGGTLGGQGTVTSTMVWNGGLIRGVVSVATGATLTLTGAGMPHEMTQGGEILNSGTMIWSDGYLWRQATDSSLLPCSITNLPTGLLEITGNNQAYVVGGKAWTFTNEGTVRKTAGTGTARIEPTAYHNTGATEVQAGILQVGGAESVSPGTFVAANGTVLLWTSGSITDGAEFSGDGEHQVRGGSLSGTVTGGHVAITGTVGGNALLTATTVLRNSAVLNGTLQIGGTLDWQSAKVEGTLTILPGATMQMSTSSYHELANGGTVNNGGHTIWSDGYLWRYSQDNSATFCSFNNLTGGLFEMTGNNSATVAASKAWTFTNAGTMRKSAGTGLSQITPTAFDNTGVVECLTGTLRIGGPDSVSPGSFISANGAIINWTTGGITNGASFTGAGEFQMSGGTLTGSMSSTSLVITGTVGGNATVSGTSQLRGGVVAGTLELTGSLNWQSGRVEGTLNLPLGASMILSTVGYHELANGGTVNTAGHTVWSDGYLWRYSQDNSATSCTFNNLAGGLFEMTGNTTATIAASKAWTFNNAGTIRKTAGAGVSVIIPTAFNNTGVVEALTGTVRLGGTESNSTGSSVAGNGAIVSWIAGNINGGASFTGEGENQMSGGTLNGAVSSANLVITGTVGGNATVSGTAKLRGAILTGTFETTGTLDWESGRVDGTLNVAPAGSLLIRGNSTYHELANGGVVINRGAATWSEGIIFRTTTDASEFPCTFYNLEGGTFDITGNNSAYLAGGRPWSMVNAGTIRKLSSGTTTIALTSFTNMAPSALIEVDAGTLVLGNFNQTAGTMALTGGNVQCSQLLIEGGVLKGTRSVVGSVTQTGGQIQPGDGVGTMTITGSFAQSGTGVLFAELGGRTAGIGHDQLIVNGAATLAGGVSGSLVNGFSPMLSEEFAVIRYASRVGAWGWMPFVAELNRKFTPGPKQTECRLITGVSPMNFTNWAEATGLSGLNAMRDADPDHDGLSNDLEYALYHFPLLSDAREIQSPAISATQRGQITYNRIKDGNDLDIEVEASDNLINWQTIARSHLGGPTTDVESRSFSIAETEFANYTTVTVIDQLMLSPTQRSRFLRVRASGQ